MTSEPNDDIVLSLANEFVERYRRGERPDVSEYASRHPDHADEIRDVFPMMLLMEDNAPEESRPVETSLDVDRLGDFLIRHEIGRGGMGVVYEAVQESLGRYVALKVCPISSKLDSRHQERFRRESRAAAMLHHTNIVPVFAVGEESGMLFYAMQYIRGATIEEVIRELRHMYKTSPTANSRLTGISRSASAARHSAVSELALSLVGEPVQLGACSDSKTDSSISEVSLPGQSVTESQAGGTAKYWESVARIGVQVADALDYAHEQGTLHRDIKPSNLMLDRSGTVWVMDFGLAKSTEEQDLTQAGELIGTLRYMSPEQSAGNPDARSDIYSLGLTLYELLALRPAFEELQRSALLRAICESDPLVPRKTNPNVPRDLETIVMKAIDKEPSRRYQTATELQADLTRFLQGQPILARPISSTERLGKWIRRRPIIAGLGAALLTTFCLAFALVSYNWLRAESALETARENERQAKSAAIAEARAHRTAEQQQTLAQDRLELAESALYRSAISRADVLSQTDTHAARRTLASLVPEKDEIDRRGWEWGYLNGLVNQSCAVLKAGTEEAPWIWAIEFSQDGSLLAIGSGRTEFFRPHAPPGRLTVWDVRTAKLVHELQVANSVFALAFSSDNTRIAVSEPTGSSSNHFYWTGPATIRNIKSGTSTPLELTDGDRVAKLAFAAQDSIVIGAVRRSPYQSPIAITAWDAGTGKVVWTKGSPWINGETETCFEFHEVSEDGESIIVSTFEDTDDGQRSRLARIHVKDGTNLEYMTDHFEPHRAIFAPEISMCVDDHESGLILRDLESNHVHKLWGDDHYRVYTRNDSCPVAVFHPDRTELAAGATDGSIRLWNLYDKSLKRILRGHQAQILTVAYSHDGRWLASGDWNGEVRLWQPDGPTHHLTCYQGARENSGPASEAVAFRWDGAGVVRFETGRLQTWDAQGGRELASIALSHGQTQARRRDACFDASGERLLLPGDKNGVQLLHVESQRVLWRSPAFDSFPTALAISADGTHVACAHKVGANAKLSVFHVDSNEKWEQQIEAASVTSIAVSHAGARLAVGWQASETDNEPGRKPNTVVTVFATTSHNTGRRIVLTSGSHISAIEFNNEATQLASMTDNGQLALIDLEFMKVVAEGIAPRGVQALAWHPSSTRIAGANRELVTVWDTDLREVIQLKGEPRDKDDPFEPDVTFSPDGNKLAALQWDNNVNIWTADRYETDPASRRPTRDELAITAIKTAVERHPGTPTYRLALGQAYSRLGQSTAARKEYLTAKKELSGGDRCLLLHGGAYLEAPQIPFCEFDGYTIECWVRSWSTSFGLAPTEAPLASQHAPFLWTAGMDRVQQVVRRLTLGVHLPSLSSKFTSEDWTHYAATDDRENFRVFINGQLALERPSGLADLARDPDLSDGPFAIAKPARDVRIVSRGLMRSLRVSSKARYKDSFSPPANLESDDHSELLFDFSVDEMVQSQQVVDRSGHGRHGTLLEGWWLNTGNPSGQALGLVE